MPDRLCGLALDLNHTSLPLRIDIGFIIIVFSTIIKWIYLFAENGKGALGNQVYVSLDFEGNNGSGGNGNQTEDITNVTEDFWYEWGSGILSVDRNQIENITVYPNPATSYLRIDSQILTNHFKIYNISAD